MEGLIRYLYGPGRYNEHRTPHIVAGFDEPGALEPGFRADGKRDFRRLDGLLKQPLALLGSRNHPKPVWHLPVRAHPDDPILTDHQWADIAAEVMHRTGLAPRGDVDGVRWVAIRHADDHIHIVATLARQDGRRPNVWNDGYRVREACRVVEQRYGLRQTAPADLTPAKRPRRGESEKARRHLKPEAARTTLRRLVATAAASAQDEAHFFELLRAERVHVRKRLSSHDDRGVTGYAVALPDDLNAQGEPVWYGGGKLAADLTLPKLRHRWTTPAHVSDRPGFPLGQLPDGRHLSEPARRALLRSMVRRAAANAHQTEEFLMRLEAMNLLVKPRFGDRNPQKISGYAVAFPEDAGAQERVWYAGAGLAEDLSLPCLKRRWEGRSAPRADASDLTVEERQAIYQDAARAAAYATAQLRRHIATNPYAARDACWAASDVLHAAARATGNAHLRHAADAYDRAARPPFARLPGLTPAGTGLRVAARLLALTRPIGQSASSAVLHLVNSLIVLVESIALLHRLQGRWPQQEAAKTAKRHLAESASSSHILGEWPSGPFKQAQPAAVAMAAFPVPWGQGRRTERPQPPAPPHRSDNVPSSRSGPVP